MSKQIFSRKAYAVREATRRGLKGGAYSTPHNKDGTFSLVVHRGSNTDGTTKKARAVQIFNQLNGERKQVMAKFATIGLSEASSNTYFYAIKNHKWANG